MTFQMKFNVVLLRFTLYPTNIIYCSFGTYKTLRQISLPLDSSASFLVPFMYFWHCRFHRKISQYREFQYFHSLAQPIYNKKNSLK